MLDWLDEHGGKPPVTFRPAFLAMLAEVRKQGRDDASMCNTCGGTQHASMLTCICGGSGLVSDEVIGLREAVHNVGRQLVASNAEVEKLRAELARVEALAHGSPVEQINAALDTVESPGTRQIGSPGSAMRRAWDLGVTVEKLRAVAEAAKDIWLTIVSSTREWTPAECA
ncbi:MAG: hypothetical protein ACHREM_32600, partial [Polyangiales bacterium]